jgi:hypothetical protein
MRIPTLYKQYCFTSPLSKEELSAQLKEYLTKKTSDRSYYGTITGDKFEINRYTSSKEASFRIKGTAGTTVGSVVGTTVSILITSRLQTVLLQVLVIICLLLNFLGVFSKDAPVNLIMFIWVFFLMLIWIGFWHILLIVGLRKELKRSKELLFSLLQGTELLQKK